MILNNKDREFLLKLADLFEEHKAELRYTTSDDGIHVDLDGREVFRGFFIKDHAAKELRRVAINTVEDNQID